VDLLKSLGINRLSYGIQTLDEQLLATMNRYYSVAEAIRELEYARQQIGNVNVDTMYGFEDESDSALLNTLKTFNQLGIPSLSIYALDKQRCESHVGEGPSIDEHYERKIRLFEQAKTYLDREGYQAVLQNIFVKPDQASYRHQLRRWDNLTLLALGIASQGYAPRKPYQNAMTLKSYYQLLDENKPPIVTVDELSPEMEMARELTSKLRFTEVPIDAFNHKYGIELERVYADLIQALNELGYLEKQDGSLRMTGAASYYNNIIPMLFAPDAFKRELLALPEEYLQHYPIPNILTRIGETQSSSIDIRATDQDQLPVRERRQSNDRRLFQDTSYLSITGGIDRRHSVGRRIGDRQRYRSFVGDFLSS
jgi:oxygen-independent coproporphyrinogen-3 oxidase